MKSFETGKIVNAKLSSCCKTSISIHTGRNEYPFHYTCNKCGKTCEKNEIPYWIITNKGKYKRLV